MAAMLRITSQFHVYLTALRPWSFSASLIPVLLGAILSYKIDGLFNLPVFIVVCVIALAVHAAGNLVNTYYDFKKGVDTKKSDDKTLVEGHMTSNDVATLGGICYGIGCFGLLVLCVLSSASVPHLALVYFCGLSGSFFYTGGLGLKYIAVGDIVIFLTFGPLTVVFTYLALTGKFSLAAVVYALPLAINIECILHTNNCRDALTDQQAGIVTLAIMLGPTLSYFLFCILLFGPMIAFAYVSFNFSFWFMLPLSTIYYAFAIERSFRSRMMSQLPQKVAFMNLIFGINYLLSICATAPDNLPLLSQA
ncbi:ubiA prenyltransferase domain-containing protein 1-like [Watersipora subatra]|uniref:ubiA prenyltransferase domain-containing protein 1-like n=1 Tax=Watersipora subatra TaxID=2589382 RepID=UPI00355B7F03